MVAVTNNDGADQYERILALLHTLSALTGLLVWCNSREVMARFGEWLEVKGVRAERRLLNELIPARFRCVLLAPEEESGLTFYSHWVRDPFVWKWDQPGNLTLLESMDAQHEDSLWGRLHLRALQFEGAGPVTVQGRAIPVAGGNLMFDEDFVLVGAKQMRNSAIAAKKTDVSELLLQSLNGGQAGQPFKRVIAIGAHTEQEPPKLIHLDLYMSLTGQREEGRYIILVGRCELVSATTPDPDLVRSIDLMNAYLEAVAAQLTTLGFAVRRNPIPVVQKRNAVESYLCAYNNCLTEVVEGMRPVVWLARLSFGQEATGHYAHLKRLEDENIKLWEDLGFEVRLVDANFHTILDDQGSLHCITNEVLRITE